MNLTSADKIFKQLIKEVSNSNYGVIENTATDFILQTNDGAPNGKVITIKAAELKNL